MKHRGEIAVLAGWLLCSVALAADAGRIAPTDDPQAIKRELQSLREARAHESSDPQLLTRLAALYLDLGDDIVRDPDKRRLAYEEGARLAQRALELREADAAKRTTCTRPTWEAPRSSKG